MAPVGDSFLILGAGGHGKVVADVVRALGHTVLGYVDMDRTKLGMIAEPGGAKVVLEEAKFLEFLHKAGHYPIAADAVALAIGNNAAREQYLMKVGHLVVPCLIHPSSTVSRSARLGRGTIVLPHVVINADVTLGDAVILNTGCIVEHDCTIDCGAHLSPGTVLCGGVRVGKRAWIGAGAVVLPGIVVGRDAVVGAGATVVQDVPPGATVVGNPARPLVENVR